MRTAPNPRDLPPLLTDDDVLARVEQLIGPAVRNGTLWLLLVDGDQQQAPMIVPLDDVPYLPDDAVDGLGRVLEDFLPALATDSGPGSVVFVSERFGPTGVVPADRDWADALAAVCDRSGVLLRGVFSSTRGGVRRLR